MSISVRLDLESQKALAKLESMGLARSEAIRMSLISAVKQMKRHSQLAGEIAALEANEDDRREMQSVALFMEQLRA